MSCRVADRQASVVVVRKQPGMVICHIVGGANFFAEVDAVTAWLTWASVTALVASITLLDIKLTLNL